MSGFSLIDRAMQAEEVAQAERFELAPTEAWTPEEQGNRATRIARSMADYWYWKRTYFVEDAYTSYAPPAQFHRTLVEIMGSPGVQVVAGPRDHAKTVEAKQYAAWLLLTGRYRITGTISSTMPKSSNILKDITSILEEHPRITEDWRPEIKVANTEALQMRTRVSGPGPGSHWRYMEAFSEGKSVRGYSRAFGRPSWILGDDIETLQSAMGSDQVEARIRMVAEAYSSLERGGTLVWLGNNLDTRCALNRLLIEQEQGILPGHWRVHVFRAWQDGKPLWSRRFPARTEKALRKKLGAKDEADWQANFQQNPIPSEGIVFLREHYKEYTQLPDDAMGVLFVDPNLALKSMGDTTAIVSLLYSPERDLYYLAEFRCKSYADPNLLLTNVLTIRDHLNEGRETPRIFLIGMDGHVSQESNWTAHIRNYCRIQRRPFPRLKFCRIQVDLAATNLQAIYAGNRLHFPLGMAHTEEGSRALTQWFAFKGKKAGRADDFPDSMISANELLHETGFVRPDIADDSEQQWTVSVTDRRRF